MAVWYHIETTCVDGTTWRSSQPVPNWERVVEWVRDDNNYVTNGGVARIEITRHADPDFATDGVTDL